MSRLVLEGVHRTEMRNFLEQMLKDGAFKLSYIEGQVTRYLRFHQYPGVGVMVVNVGLWMDCTGQFVKWIDPEQTFVDLEIKKGPDKGKVFFCPECNSLDHKSDRNLVLHKEDCSRKTSLSNSEYS